MKSKIHFPSEAEVAGFDLKKLEGEVEQHMKNIRTYEDILLAEKTRLTVAENVVIRKRQMMAEKKNG